MNLNKKGKLYIFLKNNLPLKAKHYLYFLMHFKNNLKIKIPHWILKFLVTTIYDQNNNLIGEHNGATLYTIGQRQGLQLGGIKGKDDLPWYVYKKDINKNEIYQM